jgi:hypothetical protein
MYLGHIKSEPARVLEVLIKARRAMEKELENEAPWPERYQEIDELIDLTVSYISEDQLRMSAIVDARKVAKVLIENGGEAAREAIGVPPPDHDTQASIRGKGDDPFFIEMAEKLNAVELKIPDDAACEAGGGAGMWVSAWIFLPVYIDEESVGAKRR